MNLSLYVPDEKRPRLREIQDLARGAGLSISSEFMRFLDSRESALRDLCVERLSRVMGESDSAIENVNQAEIPVTEVDKESGLSDHVTIVGHPAAVERYLNRHAK